MSTQFARLRFLTLLIVTSSAGCDSSAISDLDERHAVEGGFHLTTETTGAAIDPDGYIVVVDSSRSRTVGVNDTTTSSGLPAGNHDVRLTGIAWNCSSTGANRLTVTVAEDAIIAVHFDVACVFVVGRWQIAFTSDRDGNEEIYVMNLDGSDLARLTDHPARDFSPAWSPDGSKVAFATDRDGNAEIYVMGAGGSNPVRLTDDPASDYDPSWSPDGTTIAFTTERDGNKEVYIVDADGSNLARLTDDPASDFDPVWSPDGTRVAFASDRDGGGESCPYDQQCHAEIYVMDAGGSSPVRLTDSLSGEARRAWSPAWSPDGTRITFTSGAGGWLGDAELWVVEADGSNPVRLTGLNSAEPAWSPSGSHLVFSRADWGGDDDIWIVKADGSGAVKVTDYSGADWGPTWSAAHPDSP